MTGKSEGWSGLALFVVALASGCGSRRPNVTSVPKPSNESAPSCCASYDDIRALDGRRVTLIGVYEPTAVRKGPPSAEDDAAARTVAIRGTNGTQVMLEVYYAPIGTRSDDEIRRFAHQRVRIVGRLHLRTPANASPGIEPAETMIGPCITDVESIEEAP
jgi:hypothetical protein